MSHKTHISRRKFLKQAVFSAGAVLGAPSIVPASVLGKNGAVAPSNKITIGCIGVGWMGTDNMENFLLEPDARIVAVCDVDKTHLENARNIVNKQYGNQDCQTYHDFREVLARKDIDAVSLGLPDHWHAIPAIEAAKASKDIYGEKPLSHDLKEGRAMCNAVKRYKRIWQTGSWQRSRDNFRFACELVRNNRIGKVHRVEVGLPEGHSDFAGTTRFNTITNPPAELDYERWLGPAPYLPYVKSRVHKNWRWHLNYGGGQIMDWVGHHVDIAHWGLNLDHSGPLEVFGKGEYPRTGVWNSATKYHCTALYKNDLTMIIAGGYPEIMGGTKWIGEHGWVWVNRGGLDAHPKSLLDEIIGPEETHLLKSPGHIRNFLDCIKSRAETLAPCETAHRSATPGHLSQIAMLLGRKIHFDPVTEEIINDPSATAMLGRTNRSPWRL